MRSLFALAFFLIAYTAYAVDCPENAKSCKVLVLTPEEEQLLVNPRGILDTAAQARQLDLANVVAYFRAKIDKAEAGTVLAAPKPLGEGGKAPSADAPKDVPVPTPDPRK